MARGSASFGKRQRERDKQAKAEAKRARRLERSSSSGDAPDPDSPQPAADQAAVLASLDALQPAYDEGRLSLEDLEARRAELLAQLRVD